MKITLNWLKENNACAEGVKWFKDQEKSDAVEVLESLISQNQLDWANWTIVRVMNRPQYIAYAIFAAEQVVDIFQKRYPNDDRPRKAIDAAKAVLKKDTTKNRAAARAAARDAAGAAAGAAAGDAAWAAAGAAARDAARAAARDAAGAAWAAAGVAWAAAGAAGAAAGDAARDAAWVAGEAMKKKILEYGIGLLRESSK